MKTTATGCAYYDYVSTLENKLPPNKDRYTIRSFMDFLLLESVFNNEYKPGRHHKSTATFRDVIKSGISDKSKIKEIRKEMGYR